MEEETKEKEGLEEATKDTAAEPKEGAQGSPKIPEKPIDKMTALELRDFVKDIPGVDGVTAIKKEQLLAIAKEHLGIKDDKPSKGAAAGGASLQELKARIAGLKIRKKEAHESKRGKDADVLRRRINRLKKMTRKVPRG